MPVETPLQPIQPINQPKPAISKAGTAGTLAIVGLIASTLGLGVMNTDKDGKTALLVVDNSVMPESPESENILNTPTVTRSGTPRLVLPASPVDPYTLVRVQVLEPGIIDDIFVMSAIDSSVVFVDVIESKIGGEFVFTGPPSTYSIRVKCQGASALTGRVVIGRAPQPPAPDPSAPVSPRLDGTPANPTAETTATFSFSSPELVTFLTQLDGRGFLNGNSPVVFTGLSAGSHTFQVKAKNTAGKESSVISYSWVINQSPLPPPDPVPAGKYGFGPLAFQHASQISQPARSRAIELAGNFEAVAAEVAAGVPMTAQETLTKVSSKNQTIYLDPAVAQAWMPFRQAWKAKADELNSSGSLRNLATDYADAFRETATGLRAVR